MLTFNINRLLKIRGVEKPYAYMVASGFSSDFSARIIKNKTSTLPAKQEIFKTSGEGGISH